MSTGMLSDGIATSSIRRGMKAATPVVMGYIPIAIAFGILASQVGLGIAEAAAMSVFVFAGSAQFIAVGMIGAGNSIGAIVVTTFLVNLRHLLMSAALSPHLRGLSHKELAWFGFQLTDETFALHSTRFREGVPDVLESFALNGTAQVSWVLGTIAGVLVGGVVSDVDGLGMDYTLPAMFIALVFIQVHNSTYFTVGVLGGAAAMVFQVTGMGVWSIIAATVLAATAGVVLEQWKAG